MTNRSASDVHLHLPIEKQTKIFLTLCMRALDIKKHDSATQNTIIFRNNLIVIKKTMSTNE